MANLAVDIGNTNTHLAVFKGNKVVSSSEFLTVPAVSLKSKLKKVLGKHPNIIDRIGISSVQPGVNRNWEITCRQLFGLKPLFISYRSTLPLKIGIKKKSAIGSDRICNAICGYEKFRKKENVLIVSGGTAITIDVVLKSGEFIGGIIAPGITTSAKALNTFTGKLPLLKNNELKFNKRVIGINTKEAICSGIVNISIYGVNSIIAEIERIFKCNFRVIITGGSALKFRSYLTYRHLYIKNTVLEGINYMLRYNQK
jgi:type III pantothenate kinase